MQEIAPVEIKVGDEQPKQNPTQPSGPRRLVMKLLSLMKSRNKLEFVENTAYNEVNLALKDALMSPEKFQKQAAFLGFIDELEKVAVSMQAVWSKMPFGSRVYNELVGTKSVLQKGWNSGNRISALNKVRASRGKDARPVHLKYTPELPTRDTYRKPGLTNEPTI